MYSALFEFITRIHPLTLELEQAIASCLSKQNLNKKTLLLEEGKVCDKMYFIEKGLARAYYYLEGQEVTSWFMEENDLIISVYSFFSQKPSHENIELLEDSTLIFISQTDLLQLYQAFPVFNLVGRVLTENYYVRSEERVISHRLQSSEQRYTSLYQSNPGLFNRAQKNHIASYLGMSPETLSRLRAKKK